MRKLFLIITAVLFLASCKEERPQQNVMLVKPTLFYEKMAEHKGQVVDVRTPQEYKSGYIKDAVNIHLYDADFDERVGALDKNVPVYVYCKAGGRSAEAVVKLKENGFKNIVELDGGIDAWNDAKKPLQKPYAE